VTRVEKAFAELPPPRPRCIASIALPARDEADRIEKAVLAIVAQRRLDGLAFDPDAYELLVFANGCSDDTAAVVERCAATAPRHAVHVVRASASAPESRNVGAARRAAMDAAAARMSASGVVPRAVLTTDADSVVAADWVAQNLAALRTADAVGGRVVADPVERAALPATVRAELDAKTTYEFALAALESAVDPVPYDPWPRHWQRCGPSLALRASAYLQAGGLPVHERLEDLALYRALLAIDARFRHSTRVRVVTSLRIAGRVEGGFGSEVAAMRAIADAGRTTLVEDPRTTYRMIAARAALRRWWRDRAPTDQHDAVSLFELEPAFFREHVAAAPTFGIALASAQRFAVEHGRAQHHARVPIALAKTALSAYAVEARANASLPDREMVSSGT
jgi:hypothetical protein